METKKQMNEVEVSFESIQKQITETLAGANMGMWTLVVGEGRPQLTTNETASELMGLDDDMSPEDANEFFQSHVDPDYKENLDTYTNTMLSGVPSEVVYPYNHPTRGKIVVRCGGRIDSSYTGPGVRLHGYHQDISKHNKSLLEQIEISKSFANMYYDARIIDLQKNTYKALIPDGYMEIKFGVEDRNYDEWVKKSTKSLDSNINQYVEFMNLSTMEERLSDNDNISMECHSTNLGWSRVIITPIHSDSSGKIKRILCVVRNIEEEKRQEESYHELQRQADEISRLMSMQEEMTEAFPIGIFAYTIPGYEVVIANMEAQRTLGKKIVPGMTVRNEKLLKNVLPHDKNLVEKSIRRLKNVGDAVEYTFKIMLDSGDIAVVACTSRVCQFKNGTKYILSGIRDITETVTLNRRYDIERAQFREALLHDAIYYFSFDATDGVINNDIIMGNGESLLNEFGMKLPIKFNEFASYFMNDQDIVLFDKKYSVYFTSEGLVDIYKKGMRSENIDFYSRRSGRYERVNPLLSINPDNGHVMVTFIVYDITSVRKEEIAQKQRLEEALHEADKANKAKNQFLSNMSHDIRTPMNAIIGMAQIAQNNCNDLEKVNECLANIQLSASHLLSLINDILDMSKLEFGDVTFKEEPIDLIELMDHCLTMIEPQAKEMNVEVIVNKDQKPKDIHLLGSPLHLRQIFINLASNGIKYNKPGGKLELCCREISKTDDIVEYEFAYKDTGIGMSKEFIERIYDPFTQEMNDSRTIYKGTGLGLSIVKRMVDNMGGSIDVTSEKGVGTAFSVRIPFKINKEYERTSVEVEEEVFDLSGCKILLVEDNELNMEIAKCLLIEEGATIFEATDGQMAVELAEGMDDTNKYDVILMDVMMPVMDGLTATRKIRQSSNEIARNIPIIAMTANAFAEDVDNCLSAGMNDHIAKPMDIRKVILTIKKWKK